MQRGARPIAKRLAVPRTLALASTTLGIVACGGTLDAGSDRYEAAPIVQASGDAGPHLTEQSIGTTLERDASAVGPVDASQPMMSAGDLPDASQPMMEDGSLPFDETAPVILCNDGPFDNWQGEFALLSVAAGLDLVGLVVNNSPSWQNLEDNVAGWQTLVDAARSSGIAGIPEPLSSAGAPLVRPASGRIEETQPNRSAGAQFIVETANSLAGSAQPLVVVTGGRLTDVADAYLIDPSLEASIVVVSSLGQLWGQGAHMGIPNGEMDPWAGQIVAERLRYVQVSAFYDQTADVPTARVGELPMNALGDWMASKQSRILDVEVAADQVSLLVVAVPAFARSVQRASYGSLDGDAGTAFGLRRDEAGSDWLVSEIDGQLATERLWEMLGSTF
jgi:hypothetical protein